MFGDERANEAQSAEGLGYMNFIGQAKFIIHVLAACVSGRIYLPNLVKLDVVGLLPHTIFLVKLTRKCSFQGYGTASVQAALQACSFVENLSGLVGAPGQTRNLPLLKPVNLSGWR